ncbi:unnamed protein product [Bursaphelenchus xylophilus]|nr:unnamed protein product [Bursaphelenchus xylophilus]CAG9119114.1 unnamed protein product [Bursaphelenchus xylophilus]
MSKSRKRKRQNLYKELDDEKNEILRKLNGKYGRKKDESQAVAVLMRSTGKFNNPSHLVFQKYVETHMNRLNVAEEPEYFQHAKWLCCFCGEQSCSSELGDLFGPYYVNGIKLPPFLHKPDRKPKDEFDYLPVGESWNYDIWMHADCAVWADGLIYFGGKLLNLENRLAKFWKEKCKVCGKIGASVTVGNTKTYVHYPCAVKSNYEFNRLMLQCEASSVPEPSNSKKKRKLKRSQ